MGLFENGRRGFARGRRGLAPFFVAEEAGSVAMSPLSLDATSIFLLCCELYRYLEGRSPLLFFFSNILIS